MPHTNPLFCFVHIERAGGTTLHAIFRNNYPIGYLSLTPWYLWSNEDGNHLTAKEVVYLHRLLPAVRGFGGHTTRSYLGYADALKRPVHYLTFVRDPVARYISHYNYQRSVMKKPWTIDSFLDDRRFDNYMTKRIAGRFDVAAAKQQLTREFAFVGLTDRFDESLLLMRAALKLDDFDLLYQKRNASRDPNYREDPSLRDESVRARIRSKNALDQELYEFVVNELYPTYVRQFGAGLDAAVRDHLERKKQFHFSKTKQVLWQSYRHLVYRHLEFALHHLHKQRPRVPHT